MGKRSNSESKLRHREKQQVKNILLTYSFRDSLKAETVYTRENGFAVQEHLKKCLGFTQHLADYGEFWRRRLVSRRRFSSLESKVGLSHDPEFCKLRNGNKREGTPRDAKKREGTGKDATCKRPQPQNKKAIWNTKNKNSRPERTNYCASKYAQMLQKET